MQSKYHDGEDTNLINCIFDASKARVAISFAHGFHVQYLVDRI